MEILAISVTWLLTMISFIVGWALGKKSDSE